jgi:hypothetical protein
LNGIGAARVSRFRVHGQENPMATNILDELGEALDQIDRPGTFCVSGSVPGVLTGLEVEELGLIGLPLTAKQAKELLKQCEQAPYGKGEKTIVDTSVRRVWRMSPDHFSLTNPDWDRFIKETVGKVQQELGLEKQKLESHLYDLLLYEPGSFFLPHRDGEKLNRMVATLVIVLPSTFEGGELIVRHEGQEKTIDFNALGENPFHIRYAAFYADCEHEVRPLRKGYRLCLVYNLTLAKSKKSITAPRAAEHIEKITSLLREWSKDESAEKLVITLDHQYTKDGIAWDTLKGVDRAKASILSAAARQAGCRVYLGLLTFWESGSAEEEYDGGYGYGYGRSRGRWYDDEDDEDDEEEDEDEDDQGGGQYTMDEVFDSSLTAEHLSDPEGNSLPIGTLNVEEDELLDSDSLRDVKPEEQYEGYTGNEGMTLDRWYRHAAILLWPERLHFEIICDRDGRDVIPVLDKMVAEWRKSKARDAETLKERCIDLARAILAKWPANPYARTRGEKPERGDILKTLAELDDPELIRQFLGEVLIKDVSAEPGKSLVTVCEAHGWGAFQPELLTVMKSTTTQTMERNVRLLEQIGTAKPREKKGWSDLCASLANELISAIEALDRKADPNDWYAREVNRAEVLAGLARALIASDQPELLSRVVDHALAAPKKYPLHTAHIPALESLQPWLKKNLKKRPEALARWAASCREQLESLTAQAPQEPTDFRRDDPIMCKCADCAELKRFLKDPAESVHRFSMRQDRRSHLEHNIRDFKVDLDLRTERQRSPHTLVCTKNKASYQAKLKKYHQDQKHLAMIRSIEADLPR